MFKVPEGGLVGVDQLTHLKSINLKNAKKAKVNNGHLTLSRVGGSYALLPQNFPS